MILQEIWNDIVYWWEKTAPAIWDSIGKWWASAAPALVNAFLILLLGYWAVRLFTKLVRRALEKGKTDQGVQQFTVSLVNTLLKGFVIIAMLSSLGVNVTSLIAALGAAGVTAGLALKDSLANFVSGVTLLYTRPFKVGDFIDFSGNSGTVLEIQLMYTILKTADNKHVVIPNSHLTSTDLVNSSSEETRRAEFSVLVSGQEDAGKAIGLLSELLSGSSLTLETPAPQILSTALDNRGITLTAYGWCRAEDLLSYQHEIWQKIQQTLQDNQIPLGGDRLFVDFLKKNEDSSSEN